MPVVTLGRTGITTDKNGFGALPIQRISKEEAAGLLRRAYQGGITFFDTARAYTDSEEKIGYALSDIRSHIYIATKTHAKNVNDFWRDLETSLTLSKRIISTSTSFIIRLSVQSQETTPVFMMPL